MPIYEFNPSPNANRSRKTPEGQHTTNDHASPKRNRVIPNFEGKKNNRKKPKKIREKSIEGSVRSRITPSAKMSMNLESTLKSLVAKDKTQGASE